MKQLDRFSDLVTKLQSTNGRLEKEAYLREYADDAEVLEILKFLFNPYIVSGISDKKLNKFKNVPPMLQMMESKHDADFAECLKYFTKNNTGRDEDVRHLVTIAKATDHEELVYSLIKKSLKLGIQATTLNKVFGEGFVPKFDLMLAESYAENPNFLAGRDFIISEKLDGVRCLLMFNEGVPTFFSRQGQAILDLVELTEQVKHLPNEYVYDGELLMENKNNIHSKDLYRETVRITSSDNIKRGIIYNMFDMVLLENFKRGEDPTPAIERKDRLIGLIGSTADKFPNIKALEKLYFGNNVEEIDKHLNQLVAIGGEGVMVNLASGAYQCKRTKNLLKVKQFNTADVEVLSIEEGTGANRGKLGAVIVKFIGPDGKFYTCKVGSGFKLEEREYFWKNPEEIIGKIIEIGYFELSQNQNNDDYSLRFPTFKYVRNDKTEISMH